MTPTPSRRAPSVPASTPSASRFGSAGPPDRVTRRGGWRRANGAGLIGFLLVAFPAAASAGSTGASPTAAESTEELRPRLERACLRIPNLQIRTDNLSARLQGDATTRGSLAWLQVQIDRAGERGFDDLVVVLENRLAVRTATIRVLEHRADELDRLAERCAELGIER